MLGGWFSAQQALELHFVQRVVDEGELRSVVRECAEKLKAIPPVDVQITKQGMHRQYELMGMINMALLHNRLPPGALAQGGE